jgi:hypothetical protein
LQPFDLGRHPHPFPTDQPRDPVPVAHPRPSKTQWSGNRQIQSAPPVTGGTLRAPISADSLGV